MLLNGGPEKHQRPIVGKKKVDLPSDPDGFVQEHGEI